MKRRSTIQRNLVLETVKRLKSHATADEIYQEIAKDHPHIGRGTVYRNLQCLCETGEIARRNFLQGPDRFDHIPSAHYHAQCSRCGRLFDIEMPYIKDLEAHIQNAHGFVVTGHDILFKGICSKCQSAQHTASTDIHNP